MNNKRYICYTATHNDSGLIYVGVTSNTLDQRKQGHKDGAKKKNGTFPEAVRNFGIDAFTWNVVAEGTKDVMLLLERLLIYEWDTAHPDFGYNKTGGAHPAQIRYQLKKESWKTFGPPWNKPVPEEAENYLEFEAMMDAQEDALHMMHVIERMICWVERNYKDEEENISNAAEGYNWVQRLNKICKQLSV